MEKELLVGVDEFTVVLHLKEPVDSKDWLLIADKFIVEFLSKSKVELLFDRLIPMTSRLPAGYTEALTVENVTWYFAIAMHEYYQEMGVIVRFSAEAWAWYQRLYMDKFQQPMSIAVFYQQIQSDNYETRISRIDLTADYYNYGELLKPNTIYNALVNRAIVVVDGNERAANRKITHYGTGGFIETVYIGSKKENTKALCRIYDKRLEQINKNGFRLDEALACDDWTRFEISYRGTYAWQCAEQLLCVNGDIELSQCIAGKITDKFRFYVLESEDYTEYTNDLLDIKGNDSFSALRSENPRNNNLRESIAYLLKGSGLFPTLYKIGYIWGEDAEIELLRYLYNEYKAVYEPDAYKDRKLMSWIANNYKTLHDDKVTSFLPYSSLMKGGGENEEVRSPNLGKDESHA